MKWKQQKSNCKKRFTYKDHRISRTFWKNWLFKTSQKMIRRMGSNFHAFLKNIRRTATESGKQYKWRANTKKTWKLTRPDKAQEKHFFSHVTVNRNEQEIHSLLLFTKVMKHSPVFSWCGKPFRVPWTNVNIYCIKVVVFLVTWKEKRKKECKLYKYSIAF